MMAVLKKEVWSTRQSNNAKHKQTQLNFLLFT